MTWKRQKNHKGIWKEGEAILLQEEEEAKKTS
jgi:hypothetical protein